MATKRGPKRRIPVRRSRPGGPAKRAAPEGKLPEERDSLSPESGTALAGPWLPIVGIGASAGGIDPLTQILKRLPDEPGLPIVVVQHLSPHHKSLLSEVLQEATRMRVTQVNAETELEANHVYVIPPDHFLELAGGRLRLLPHPGVGSPHPIDSFFRSLARAAGPGAVGVILSGSGSDGAIGLREIHAAGGITIVQDPASAEHDGMPQAALNAAVVDLVLTPGQIAQQLVEIAKHPPVLPAMEPEPEVDPETSAQLARVFALLRKGTGVDFSQYKKATVTRRIQRRMLLHKQQDLDAYVALLANDPKEQRELHHDLLIQVTSFFREPSSFELLAKRVLPEILKAHPDGPLRVWVPACASGEEAYSIAIVLIEVLGADAQTTRAQVFATDLSENAIERARAGVYPENISEDLGNDRLRRFFSRTDGSYRVAQSVRELCVFARQDVTRDPPFSRLDLIVCRNLLIYLEPPLQKKLMHIFHYALKPGGFLLLGQAETIGPSADLFAIHDKNQKLYVKKSVETPVNLEFASISAVTRLEHRGAPTVSTVESPLLREARQQIMSRYGPPGVIVDGDLNIVESLGPTGPYLELGPGTASLSLLKMARPGLVHTLRMAAHAARRDGRPVRREGAHVTHNGDVRTVNVSVSPLGEGRTSSYLLVLFEDPASPVEKAPRKRRERAARKGRSLPARLPVLEHELEATRQHMQAMIQDLEAANEELQSANEEILSSNEELQSTNEELNTAREELQSTNEEINTVNEELHSRNDELIRVNSDLNNLLTSVNATVVIVGGDLRIRRFTPTAGETLNLIASDVGRPINHLRPNIDCPDLDDRIRAVIDSVTPYEGEVRDVRGRWLTLGIRPYKDVENRIDGAVLLLVDIHEQKQLETAMDQEQQLSKALADACPDWVVVLDAEQRVQRANAAFCDAFRIDGQDVREQSLPEIDSGFEDPRVRELVEDAFARPARGGDGHDVELELPLARAGRRSLELSASRVETSDEAPLIVLVARERGMKPDGRGA